MKVYSNRGKMVLHVLYKDGVKTKDILKNIDYITVNQKNNLIVWFLITVYFIN